MFRRSRAVVVALVLVGLLGASCKSGDNKTSFTPSTTAKPRQLAAAAVPPPGVPEPTKLALRAIAIGPAVNIYASAGATKVENMLPNPTLEGMPLAFFVVDRQDDWLQVRAPERPNNALHWIKADEVDLAPVDNRIVISVSQRNLRLLDKAQKVIYETNVAVGKPKTPTPLGRFYVDVWLPNPGRPYGQFMLSIGGFSEVYKTFEGGRGQVAMHGWADNSVMGQNVSNGCVRMRNADIVKLSEMAPLGTPVEILA